MIQVLQLHVGCEHLAMQSLIFSLALIAIALFMRSITQPQYQLPQLEAVAVAKHSKGLLSERIKAKPKQDSGLLESVLHKTSNQIGTSEHGSSILQPLNAQCPHALIVGPTGTGKSSLAAFIASKFSGQVWMVSGSEGKRTLFPGVSNRTVAPQDPEEILMLMESRSKGNYSDPLLILIDRFEDLNAHPQFRQAIYEIARTGRELQIHLLVCCQYLDGVEPALIENCSFKVLTGASNHIADRLKLSKHPSFKQGKGIGLVQHFGEEYLMEFELDVGKELTAPDNSEAANPLIRSVSMPRLEPDEEFFQFHQSPSDPSLVEGPPEPQDPLDRQHERIAQHRKERYSKTL